jgi:hypothetical protein
MPPGYETRLAEIQRLIADLNEMNRFARLLTELGPRLAESARDVFAALKFETELVEGPADALVAARLDGQRRLLVVPSSTSGPVQKKSAELTEVFRVLQEVAGDADRVVLVSNVDPETRPADRPPAIAPDALALLARMGAVHFPASALFKLWKLSFQGMDRARGLVERLHAADPGTFELPASVLR